MIVKMKVRILRTNKYDEKTLMEETFIIKEIKIVDDDKFGERIILKGNKNQENMEVEMKDVMYISELVIIKKNEKASLIKYIL